jgi:hypothetical protein
MLLPLSSLMIPNHYNRFPLILDRLSMTIAFN